MGIRAGAVAGTATVFFLFAPAIAAACSAPDGDLGAVSGRAGDTVSFTLPGTSPGAQWSVSVEGAAAGSGTDSDEAPGTEASLTVPDLGPSARDAEGIVTVECEGGPRWSRVLTLHYEGRVPAGQPPAGPVASPSAPAGAGAAPASSPAAPHGAPRRSRTGAGRPRDGGGVRGVRYRSLGLGPGLIEVAKTRERARKARRAKRRRHKRKLRRRPARERVAASARPAPPAPGGGGVDLSGGEIPIPAPAIAWRLLAAIALAGLATIALLALRTRRRRATGA